MCTVADQIRSWVPGRYAVLGTDGYGRSDSRRALRGFFEIDRDNIVCAALKALAADYEALQTEPARLLGFARKLDELARGEKADTAKALTLLST